VRHRALLLLGFIVAAAPTGLGQPAPGGVGEPRLSRAGMVEPAPSSARRHALQFDFLYRDYFGLDPAGLERPAAWLGEPDLVVALHLRHLSGVDLDVIVTWRREGVSWNEITRRCRRGSQVYYVELPRELELPPPYARAYGHWRQHAGAELALSDAEVRELVLLRVMSEGCALPAAKVVRLRASGFGPRAIAVVAGRLPEREDLSPPAPPRATPRSGR